MAVRKRAPLLLLALLSLTCFSWAGAFAEDDARADLHSRRLLYRTTASKAVGYQAYVDYVPPHVHVDPPSSPDGPRAEDLNVDYVPPHVHVDPPSSPDGPWAEDLNVDYVPPHVHVDPPSSPDGPWAENENVHYDPPHVHPPTLSGPGVWEIIEDYGPPHVNPPIHVDPPSTPPLESGTDADMFTDYAPLKPNTPKDSPYPPGPFDPPQMKWSSEASFMHATLPSPTIVDRTDNLSGN